MVTKHNTTKGIGRMTSPLEVRQELVDALQLDLIGPTGPLGNHKEVLTQTPSRWYLTGFLVPTDADEDQTVRSDQQRRTRSGCGTGGTR